MRKKTMIINLAVLACAAVLITCAVKPHGNVRIKNKEIQKEPELFEMSLEQLMEVEVASNSEKKEKLSQGLFYRNNLSS